MSGRALIIVVTGIIITTSIILYSIGASSTRIVRNVNQYYSRQSAQNIAQSGVNLAIRRLVNDYTWRANTPWTLNMMGGKASIRAFDASYGVISNVVCIQSVGIEDYNTTIERRDTSTAYAWVPPIAVPTWTKALVNLNGINQVNGGITVDGRDFDAGSTTPNPGQGNWGIWSTAASFSQSGSSTIGGTTGAGLDVAPQSDPLDTVVIRLNQTYPGGYPTSPDSAFNYSEGTLKALALSGFGGSQYVTDPSKLTYPLHGVTYVEMPNGSPQNRWNANALSGSGILVVHNSAHSANLDNAGGTFNGILIGDDITHLHMDFWGAMMVMSPFPQGNVLGNGNAYLRYSRQAMKNAIGVLQDGSQLKILGWYE